MTQTQTAIFGVGDRVIGIGEQDAVIIEGLHGTVVLDKNKILSGSYGIRFDNKHFLFHSLAGDCEEGYGYWVAPHKLRSAEIQYVPTQEGDKDNDI